MLPGAGEVSLLPDDRAELEVPAGGEQATGSRRLRWPGEGAAVMMTGDAVRVFDGEIDL